MARKRKHAGPQAPEPSPESRPGWLRLRFFLVVATAAVAYAVQAWHAYPVVASAAGGLFLHNDSAYHARRVLITVERGTILPPVYDPLEAWPEGARVPWPPLHDTSVALLARLGGSTRSDPGRGMATAGAFPVLEGIGLIFAAALLACVLAAAVLAGRSSDVRARLRGAAPVLFAFAVFTVLELGQARSTFVSSPPIFDRPSPSSTPSRWAGALPAIRTRCYLTSSGRSGGIGRERGR